MLNLSRRDLVPLILLIIAAALVFGLPLYHLIIQHHGVDYNAHIAFGRALADGQLYFIHLLFHGLALAFQALPLLNWETAAWLIIVIFSGVTATVLYVWLRSFTSSRLVALIAAFALIIVTPITVLTWAKPNLYNGYISINLIHNPTMIVMKLFALLSFIFALNALTGRLRFNARNVVIGAALVTLSMFAKPNFALVLLPALMIVLVVRYVRARETTGLRLTFFGLIVPMIVVLPVQYALQYALIANPTDAEIILAPFSILRALEPSALMLGVKFLLSIAFPLAITLLYRRAALSDIAVILGWLMFAAGATQYALFAESGIRFQDANFQWSAQIGLFLLFVAAARVWLANFKPEPRAYVSGAIFALHVASGVVMLVAMTLVEREFMAW